MSEDLEAVKKIILMSGNTFHCKVLKYFQEKGWTVLISPYYNDNLSNKPREIDLIAEKAFDATDNGHFLGTIHVKLFIECKYIPHKTVFWFHDKDKQKAEDLITQSTPLRKDNTYTQKHHYLEGDIRVAKLFADERKKSADNEIFYKALNQSLNAMVYYRNQGSIIKLPPGKDSSCQNVLNYPIIICNRFNNLYRVEIDKDVEPTVINDNFQLEVNYAYRDTSDINKNEYFLIDILDFNLLDKFLEKIKTDTKLVTFFLN